jgi:hypothetical protein
LDPDDWVALSSYLKLKIFEHKRDRKRIQIKREIKPVQTVSNKQSFESVEGLIIWFGLYVNVGLNCILSD